MIDEKQCITREENEVLSLCFGSESAMFESGKNTYIYSVSNTRYNANYIVFFLNFANQNPNTIVLRYDIGKMRYNNYLIDIIGGESYKNSTNPISIYLTDTSGCVSGKGILPLQYPIVHTYLLDTGYGVSAVGIIDIGTSLVYGLLEQKIQVTNEII